MADEDSRSNSSFFSKTDWSQLNDLNYVCDKYRRPVMRLISHFLRTLPHRPPDIDSIQEDWFQSFWAHFIDKKLHSRADKTRCVPFRVYLQTVLRNFLVDQLRRLGRDPSRRTIEFDEIEVAGQDDRDEFARRFKRECRSDILQRAYRQVEATCRDETGRLSLRSLSPVFAKRSDSPLTDNRICEEVACQLRRAGIDTNADAVAASRSRKRRQLRIAIRTEIRKTLPPNASEDDIDSELADLL